MKTIEFHSVFRITFNYLDLNVLPFTFHMEDGERRPQLFSYEHDWFRPDLKKKSRGR